MDESGPEDLRTVLIENSILVEQLEACEAERDRAGAAAPRPSPRTAAPVLSPDEVSALVDRLLDRLASQLPGLTVRDASLQLRVGVQKLGGETGFVVPVPDSPPEMRENLHEISVHFNCATDR